MNLSRNEIETSLNKLEKWVEDHNYMAYEPFDGLLSFLRPLAFGNIFLDRILMQVVRRCPFNLRPLIGIKPQVSTKGRGYMAWGYLTRYKHTKNDKFLAKAVNCLDWLIQNKSPKFKEYSWANHFDFSSRGGRYRKHESIIVWTSLIGQAFIEAYQISNDEKYLEVIESICAWILALPREKTPIGTCLSYNALGESSIHNANMLGAAMLAHAYKITQNEEYYNVAKEAMRYSCTRQLPDGAWLYGEQTNNHWIDNFHTGYNLDSLKCYIECTGDKEFEDQLARGFNFFKNNFFESDGMPKYYHNDTYPVDSQCASQAIETLANFSELDDEALCIGLKVAKWTIDNMQDKTGYFYYRLYSYGVKDKTPMLHWAQATTYKGLSLLLSKIENA